MDSNLTQVLANYKPAPSTSELIESTRILLLVGPTGAGKDSLKDKLLETGDYHHIISHTTRPPRINHGIKEIDGIDYHFISYKTAKKMLDNQEFIEAKIVSGNLYGTSIEEIRSARSQNRIAMNDIDVQGVSEYKALDSGVMAVFLLPPDFKTWQERLSRRYGDVVNLDDHIVRLKTALYELNQLLNTDYYVAVINDDLDKTFEEIHTVIVSSNHTTIYEPKAREVAKTLAKDIQDYLDSNASS
jgi:guanylate kinase